MSNGVEPKLPKGGLPYVGPPGGYGGYGVGGYGFPGLVPPIAPPAPSYDANFPGPRFNPRSIDNTYWDITVSPYMNALLGQNQITSKNMQQIAIMNNAQAGIGSDPNLLMWNASIAPVLGNASKIFEAGMNVPLGQGGQPAAPAAGQAPPNAPLPSQAPA